jgi:hypothetical protein
MSLSSRRKDRAPLEAAMSAAAKGWKRPPRKHVENDVVRTPPRSQRKGPKARKQEGEGSAKDPEGRRPPPPDTTPEEYLRAFQVYRQSPSVSAVMAAMGWGQERATRMVMDGFPEYGFVALRTRLQRFVEDTMQESLEKDRDAMRTMASESREIQVGSLRLIRQALEAGTVAAFDEEGRVIPKALKDLFEVFERAGRLFSFARGGPDSRGEVSIPGGVLSQKDMLANLIQAGVIIDADVVEEAKEDRPLLPGRTR